MKNYRANLEPNQYYHIFNHAVGNLNLFVEDKNYHFYLDKFEKYLVAFVDVYAYCLMPNHFHFLLQIKDIDLNNCQTTSLRYSNLSNAFKNFFTSYTNSYNKYYNKKGSLFQPRFKRLLIENENQLLNTIIYIHKNPLIHGFVNNIKNWSYSSYNKIVGIQKINWLKSDKVIDLFDDLSNFIHCRNKSCGLEQWDE